MAGSKVRRGTRKQIIVGYGLVGSYFVVVNSVFLYFMAAGALDEITWSDAGWATLIAFCTGVPFVLASVFYGWSQSRRARVGDDASGRT